MGLSPAALALLGLAAAAASALPLPDAGPHLNYGWGEPIRLRHLYTASKHGLFSCFLRIGADGRVDAAGSQSPQSEWRQQGWGTGQGWDSAGDTAVPSLSLSLCARRSAGDPRRGRAHRGHQGRAELPVPVHGRGGAAARAGEHPRWGFSTLEQRRALIMG